MSDSRDRPRLLQVPFDPKQYDQFTPYIDYGYIQFSNRSTSKATTYDGRADELSDCMEQDIDPPQLSVHSGLLDVQMKLVRFYANINKAVDQVSKLISDLTPHESDDFKTAIRTLQIQRNYGAGMKITIEEAFERNIPLNLNNAGDEHHKITLIGVILGFVLNLKISELKEYWTIVSMSLRQITTTKYAPEFSGNIALQTINDMIRDRESRQ